MTYVPVTVGRQAANPVTVGRRPGSLTITRGPAVTFTVTGHPGGTSLDHALLTEDGSPILLESGGYLLYA